MSLTPSMQWRYATKKFNTQKKISVEALDDLLETTRLAPSSYGLQPYKFLIIQDATVRERIREAAANQPQITEGSHLIVIAAETDLGEASVGRFVGNAAVARNVERQSLSAREQQILQAVTRLSPEQRTTWAQKQAYLALGVLVAAAAGAGIDACPMEGFDATRVDDILNLKEKELTATVLTVLGFRSDQDAVASLAKVRKTQSDLFVTF